MTEEDRKKLYTLTDDLINKLRPKLGTIANLARGPIMDGIYNMNDTEIVDLITTIRNDVK